MPEPAAPLITLPIASARDEGTRVLAADGPAATRIVAPDALYLRVGSRLRIFRQSPIVIGRAADCDFVINHPDLALHAMRLHHGAGGVWIERLDRSNDAEPVIPRRTEVPSDQHLAPGIVLRIGSEPPAARTRRLPVLLLLGSAMLLCIHLLARARPPVSGHAPIVTPSQQPAAASATQSPRPVQNATAPVDQPRHTDRLPKPPTAAAKPARATPDSAHRGAPVSTARNAADLHRLEQAEFWIARGLPQRARPLLDAPPADPALAERLYSLRAKLRRQAEDLRVQAHALASIDPEAARTLRTQAAALLFPDDPLHPVLERELP